MRPLRVLIVGCGQIAGGYDTDRPDNIHPLSHAGAYSRHGGFVLSGCVEPSEERRTTFMQRWGIAHGWSTIDQVCASGENYDVISVCSPTTLHYEHVLQSLQLAPQVLFCEKPLASTLQAARDTASACEVAGVTLAVNFTRRWAPDIVQLATSLRCGKWGTVRGVVGRYNKGIVHNGSHLIDLLRMLFGELKVDWVGQPIHDFWLDDPTVAACLKSADGVPVYLDPAHAGDYACFELHLTTSRGVLTMEEGGLSWRYREISPSMQFSGYRTLSQGHHIQGRYEEAMSAAVDNIYLHLTHNVPIACTGHEALHALTLCEELRTTALR
jgi:predicted dehydrogenase